MPTRLASLILASLLACTARAAEWRLDPERSSLSFVSLKNVDVAEAHRFRQLAGGIAPDGSTRVLIQVDSVDTGVPIRDERMREHLLLAEEYPTARAMASVDLASFRQLAAGESTETEVRFELEFRGQTVPLLAQVKVTATGDGDLQVVSTSPVLLSAERVGAAEGVAKLRELAGLQSISLAVPVYFTLHFDHLG